MAEFWGGGARFPVDIGDDGCVMLNPPNGGEPTLWPQSGAAPATGKLRCHMGLRAPDPGAEVARLLTLGATRADVGQRGVRDTELVAFRFELFPDRFGSAPGTRGPGRSSGATNAGSRVAARHQTRRSGHA